MFHNFIKTAFRSLLKNKGFNFLNIFGLAVGIAIASLIFLWVENEVNYDAVNTKKNDLYIVRNNQKYDTYIFTHSSTPGLLGPAIKEELPGIANTCRSSDQPTSLLFTKGDRTFYAAGKYTEPAIFSMFTLPFVQGNATSAFSQRYSLVITEATAKKFFGDDNNVMGKTIRVDNSQDYVISGVLKDLPENSTYKFEWLMPFQIFFDKNPSLKDWGSNALNTYVELKPGVNPERVNAQLLNYIQKHEPKAISHLFLFSMNDWHLYNEFKDGKKTGGGKIEYVHLFTIIAWIILFIACINFMNLATARSEKRAREVGVRKVLGAGKNSLISQFIGEALFMALLSAVVAVILVAVSLPAFNTLVQKQLTMGLGNPYHIVVLLLIALICGLVAGSYPAFYLSSFNPVMVLKGVKMKDSSAAVVRKGLVILQFTSSIVLIICTIIVYQQIQHVKGRQLGFNKNNLLTVDAQGDMGKNFDHIKQDLLNTGYVENAALADYTLIYGGNNGSGITWPGKTSGSKVLISFRSVTPEFMETAGLKLLAGRNLTTTDTTRQAHVVITQSLEKLIGNGSAVGKVLRYEGDSSTYTVVGVVNDFVYGDMYGKPDPVMFFSIYPKDAALMYLKVKPQKDIETALNNIQSVMKKDNAAYPFQYHFIDDQFDQLFQTETLVSKLSQIFAALAIVISCLGLFGLSAYTAETRRKEIGIRKVLGATVAIITGQLSKNFLQLIIISCLIAFPLAYVAMYKWLKGYQYRIDIQWWVFAAAGVTAVVIALLTISFQSIKAALANPIKSLRSE
jgi:putative ABC transport system permease protein